MNVEILTGAIGSILAIIIIFFYNRVKIFVIERAERSFWKFSYKKVAIIHPLYRGPKGETMPANMARIEDVMAVEIVVEIIKQLGLDYSVQNDTETIPQNTDLILICSPKGNECSQNVENKNKLPHSFRKVPGNSDCYILLNKRTAEEYWSPMDKEGEQIDIALLARYFDNNPKRYVYLFWGIHGPGTFGAAKFLEDRENIKKINRKVGNKDFSVIIKTPFNGPREVGIPEICRPTEIFSYAEE
jgi:hypothetical protein